ncbi:SDR family NAD(P)-dependent oxidoreductase [Microbacterium sp. SORGH_AS_0888]|uniref:SDR family NAD(P)-dependent oxidoreductase n=1 Tax=Microbacterium sp. SORGH_AS_0888 TaxID=3041791 RepID=UPI00277FA18D|nr:SDR family NAD(P)-dependent oxidoreductase [Microbacterium sp. SORGH_AS_0888]MDQ1129659.1 NAD(P)-dependent dehydrogenase (short-subunit alcohol dehydrogenase family) [Microbacterium sp. SORGH_AS_0888]
MTQHTGGALPPSFDLAGKVALVTGSSSGLGRAAAETLAAAGARVVVHGRDAGRAAEVVAAIAARGGQACAMTGDAADPVRMREIFDETVEQMGAPDIVMANAGIAGGPSYRMPGGRIAEYPDAEWHRTLDANLTSTLLTLREASRVMPDGGSIIVTSSTAGLRSDPFVSYGYIATKAAQVNLVRQLALELAPRRIRVNAIAPGPFKDTRIGGGAPLTPELERMWEETIPLGRMGHPEELGGPVLFLASAASSFVTGVTLPVDGGAAALSHAAY